MPLVLQEGIQQVQNDFILASHVAFIKAPIPTFHKAHFLMLRNGMCVAGVDETKRDTHTVGRECRPKFLKFNFILSLLTH